MISLIAITPAANLTEAEAFANGPSLSEFTVALNDPPTHFYLHTWLTPEEAAHWQTDTPAWLIISIASDVEPIAHLQATLTANGLSLHSVDKP